MIANRRYGWRRLPISLSSTSISPTARPGEIGRRLAQEHGIAVVFMTGNPEIVADGVKGAVGVVQKPVMPSVVEQLVKYLAARRVGMFAVVPSQMTVFA